MKTFSILFFTIISFAVNAQWSSNSATPGNIYYNNGNVGLGIVSPLGLLHLSGVGGNTWAYFQNNVGHNNPKTAHGLSLGWNYTAAHGESVINYYTSLGTRSRLSFSSFNGTVLKEEMVLEKGKVGISTNAPTSQLEIGTDLPSTGCTSIIAKNCTCCLPITGGCALLA